MDPIEIIYIESFLNLFFLSPYNRNMIFIKYTDVVEFGFEQNLFRSVIGDFAEEITGDIATVNPFSKYHSVCRDKELDAPGNGFY